MIVYQATKEDFSNDVLTDQIEIKILEYFKKNLQHSTSKNEIASWKNSMLYMDKVLNDASIPDDCGVAIEYKLPQTSKRIDFIFTGLGENDAEYAILIELKQWSEASLSSKDGVINSFVGGGVRELTHPSYQAWSYATLLENFNETVAEDKINLKPCAYLHNYILDDVIVNEHYAEYLAKAPVFLRGDAVKLRNFIKHYVKKGDRTKILYRIDQGKIRPSKMLADSMVAMLKGNSEFTMIDDQKLVYEMALHLTTIATQNRKKVLIVQGGPGTGKSVVAINLLVEITKRGLLAKYVSKNAAPRAVYQNKLAGSLKNSVISNLFSGSGAFIDTVENTFDTLIVDEAHRLNEKSGLYSNLGESQIKEIIKSSRCTIFFIDEDQRVTLNDVGTLNEIYKWANKEKADIQVMELSSQFRCNGADGYLAWLDNVLQIRETSNQSLQGIDYDFKIFSSPSELREAIHDKNKVNNKSRMVAGYCWEWKSKKNPELYDVVIPEYNFKMKWNLSTDGSLWIISPDSVNEIGCIHTCQGLEVDYIGVIIGDDLQVIEDEVVTQPSARAKSDRSVLGYKKLLERKPVEGKDTLSLIIKNTYRTLMTRGMKGCYVYFTNKEAEEYFRKRLRPELPFRILNFGDIKPFVNSVPLVNIQVAAGGFSNPQTFPDFKWVELPMNIAAKEGYFVCKVVGESMNKIIPNGSYCLFKQYEGGSREGLTVIVQSSIIQDSEFGSDYTIKSYHSEKVVSDDTWSHSKIVLKPLSNDSTYQDIVLLEDELNDFKVVGVFVSVLG